MKNVNTDTSKLLFADTTYQLRKAFFNIYNALGTGHKESVYQKALIKEFEDLRISYKQEVSLDVVYKNQVIGNYRPDFVIKDKIILEIKAVEYLPKIFEDQLIHYLKSTGYRLGFLVNFGSCPLIIKRLIWTK